MSVPVQVFVRDAGLNVIGQIEDFQSLTLQMLYNDVGTWELVLPAGTAGAALLDRVANPGGGIIVLRNGVQILSGPARGHKWSRSGATGDGVFTVVGLDDNWNLAAHLIWPNPVNAIDQQQNVWYSTDSSHLGFTRPAESIMIGLVLDQMGSDNGFGRGIPTLTLEGGDFGRGYVQLTPKNWRYNTVLDGLQQLSVLSKNPTTGVPKDELGFQLRQYPSRDVRLISFRVFLSNDNSATVRFSFNVGNLAEAEYSTTAPKATYLITGAGQTADVGSGVQINKQTFGWTRADSYYPGMYAEGFQDQSEVDPLDATATDQLMQGVNDYWSANGGQVAATFKAIDTPTMAFGTHYNLGDFVTVELPQLTFVERVRAVGLTYTPENGEELTLAVGTSDGSYGRLTPGRASGAMFAVFRAQAKKAADDAKLAAARKAAADKAKRDHAAHLKHVAAEKARKARLARAHKKAKR